MKLTINLEKMARLTVDMNDEKAKAAFDILTVSMVGMMLQGSEKCEPTSKGEVKQYKATPVKEEVKAPQVQPIADSMAKFTVEHCKEVFYREPQTGEPQRNESLRISTNGAGGGTHSQLTFWKPRLVFCECEACAKNNYKMAMPGDVMKCLCGKETVLEPEKIKLAEYTCPNCGKKAVFAIHGDNFRDLLCKECESIIDMVYIDKLDKWLSANLTK